MKTFFAIVAIFTTITAFALFPRFAGAEQTQQMQATTQMPAQNDIRHAYQPVPVSNNQWMQARVNNVVQDSNSRLVCVEAFNNANGQKTHLGCLTVDWGTTQNWAQEFNAPLYMLGSGSYTVKYTYKDSNGGWYDVTSMQATVMNGQTVR